MITPVVGEPRFYTIERCGEHHPWTEGHSVEIEIIWDERTAVVVRLFVPQEQATDDMLKLAARRAERFANMLANTHHYIERLTRIEHILDGGGPADGIVAKIRREAKQ